MKKEWKYKGIKSTLSWPSTALAVIAFGVSLSIATAASADATDSNVVSSTESSVVTSAVGSASDSNSVANVNSVTAVTSSNAESASSANEHSDDVASSLNVPSSSDETATSSATNLGDATGDEVTAAKESAASVYSETGVAQTLTRSDATSATVANGWVTESGTPIFLQKWFKS